MLTFVFYWFSARFVYFCDILRTFRPCLFDFFMTRVSSVCCKVFWFFIFLDYASLILICIVSLSYIYYCYFFFFLANHICLRTFSRRVFFAVYPAELIVLLCVRSTTTVVKACVLWTPGLHQFESCSFGNCML